MEKIKTGEILRSVCKELNLNNRQVAEIISMTPQNVSRLFQSSNVNTDTIDRLISALGVNIYGYMAQKWNELADSDPTFKLEGPQGEYFKHIPKYQGEAESKPKISILIELDADKQNEVMKLLKLQ
jgi:plasmid maintenance system antidote protein VapI